MAPISFLNRQNGVLEEEEVYGQKALDFVYGDTFLSRLIGKAALHLLVKWPFFSWGYGLWQNSVLSRKKILPFIKKFQVDPSEFLLPLDSYKSFNDFFIRKLKPSCRPITSGRQAAVMPADGRYLVYPNITLADGFVVKGKKFTLLKLLCCPHLAAQYAEGSMVMARLCPTDYHRFHFPCDNTPSKTHLTKGLLYSVNPISIKKRIELFCQNKRTLCTLDTEHFGKVLFIEVGATNVGSIVQTYTAGRFHQKGEEKGYFSFGASSLILLFEPGRIQFSEDLIQASQSHLEVRCLMGQQLGVSSAFLH